MSSNELVDHYLSLMKIVVTDYARIDENDGTIYHTETPKNIVERRLQRNDGRDWPYRAETMIGLRRLDNFQYCIETALKQGIAGDIIETGVWRGGASLLAKAVLKAHGNEDKSVWLADSFKGLPPPKEHLYEADKGDDHHTREFLAASEESVRERFALYGLLDAKVKFVVGWFDETLPKLPIQEIAVARLDGDMYESTIVALEALYHKISEGGFIIIDDYGAVPGCKKAVDDFRQEHGIFEPIIPVDWTGVFWRKT